MNDVCLKKLDIDFIYKFPFCVDEKDTGIGADLARDGSREEDAVRKTVKILKEMETENPVIFEIGANIGYYCMYEALTRPCRIYAIEPVTSNLELCIHNTKTINKVEDILFYELAIGKENGNLKLNIMNDSNAGTMMESENVSGWYQAKMEQNTVKVVEVPTETLDNFSGRLGVVPDFIRLDIEGYETEIFDSGIATLHYMPYASWLFIEMHQSVYKEPRDTSEDLIMKLYGYQFKPWYVDKNFVGNMKLNTVINLPIFNQDKSSPHVFFKKVK